MLESTYDLPVPVDPVQAPSTSARVRSLSGLLSEVPLWARLWLIVLVAFALFVDLWKPTGWLGSDDAAYHAAAEHLLTGTLIERAHHHYARMAMVVPVAVSVRLFGDTPWAVALPTTLAAIGCVVTVALIGAVTWGWWEGLCAATFLAVIPYFRVLSTAAFPDVHACFWCSVAVLAAIRSRECGRKDNTMRGVTMAILAGLTGTIALSAKVTCAAVVPIILAIACLERPIRMKTACVRALGIVSGVVALVLIEGCFHAVVAGDFWFSLHSLRNTQAATDLFAGSELRRSPGLVSFVVDRLTLPLRPAESGWGILGGAFWPVLIGSLWIDARGRALAAWGLLAYLSVAFMPVSSADGLQPMPIFHGRHVLTAIVPFTLCFGHLTHGVILAIARKASRSWQRWAVSTWPVIVLSACCVFVMTRRDLNGFQDRDTRRIGLGIRKLVDAGTLDGSPQIMMTPSMYWRFRILFPPAIRERLCVSVRQDAPSWWKQTVPGIESRLCSSPPSHGATLLTTPRQLRGEGEAWDYGCPLPSEQLDAWRSRETLAAIVRGEDGALTEAVSSRAVREDAVLLAIGVPNVP